MTTAKINPEQIWQTALGELQLQMTRATFETWIKPSRVVSYEDGTFIIGVQNAYAKDWLENRLYSMIKRTLSTIMNRTVELRFSVWNYEPVQQEPVALLNQEASITPEKIALNGSENNNGFGGSRLILNLKYTFERFIVGNSNRLAHAASLAVAETPASSYNPLFLYGGVGLGKTHLLQAIAHYAVQRNRKIIYVSSEIFTNDLINAIRTHSTQEFRDFYRNTDYLLIDDIQFIAGKESTQEEFFHTFNTLHSSAGQIVLTSDRPPSAIPTLEERLRSRFEWGLLADIQPPDFETRLAILRFKADSQGFAVPPEVMEFIARNIQSNIRELEGALNKIIAYSTAMRVPISIESARQALQDMLARKASLSLEAIINEVASFYNVTPEQLRGPARNKEVASARQMAMFLSRRETEASLPSIGEALGGRDHTTILYGYEKISQEIESNDQLRREMLSIRERLYQPANNNIH